MIDTIQPKIKFEKLREKIRNDIISWFKQNLQCGSYPCRYCKLDRLLLDDSLQPHHCCLKSGKNETEIMTYGLSGELVKNFIKITNTKSEFKADLYLQIPKKDEEYKNIENADPEDYVCLHFDPRPSGEVSTVSELGEKQL
jgi:hypothetical protein